MSYRWKAVFFDVDGVLLDSLPAHLGFCQDKVRKFDLRIRVPTPDEFRDLVARGAKANPMSEFLRTVGFTDPHLTQADADYRHEFARDYSPQKFPKVHEVLKALRGTGVPLGLVTSNIRDNVERALGEATMALFQENLVFYGVRKADALTHGAKRLEVRSEDCVFVGDVPTDKSAAQEAGVAFLGVTYGWGLRADRDYVTVDEARSIPDGLEKANVIPLPFDPLRKTLYSVKTLWEGYHPDMNKNSSLDAKIFWYFKNGSKYSPRLDELRAQRSHDAGIEYAIDEFLGVDYRSYPEMRKPVMVLGSHSKYRKDPWYARVAHLTHELSRAGFLVATGGGPGLMEAANLGAYMSDYSKVELNEALEILRTSQEPAPGGKQYEMPDYWDIAIKVTDRFAATAAGESLGVPTWFYGHEGANRFASHIAKFLSNGLRESKMTSIGTFGAIFAPGGPGTAQEVFTDAAENKYHSFQWLSPMVFFNDPNDEVTAMMLDILKKQTSPDYLSQDMYLWTTDTQQIVRFLLDRRPQFREKKD